MLVQDADHGWRIVDPAEGYQTLFPTRSYDEAKTWVMQDEYESVRGRMARVGYPELALT